MKFQNTIFIDITMHGKKVQSAPETTQFFSSKLLSTDPVGKIKFIIQINLN